MIAGRWHGGDRGDMRRGGVRVPIMGEIHAGIEGGDEEGCQVMQRAARAGGKEDGEEIGRGIRTGVRAGEFQEMCHNAGMLERPEPRTRPPML